MFQGDSIDQGDDKYSVLFHFAGMPDPAGLPHCLPIVTAAVSAFSIPHIPDTLLLLYRIFSQCYFAGIAQNARQ